jgi:trehalose 6-phosphate synthase/phosphatase
MGRLIIVSNRLPVSIEKRRDKLYFKPSVGGLATGLGSFYKIYDSKWIGWCGIVSERLTAEERNELLNRLETEFSNLPLFLSENDVNKFYYGFCNRTIWPLFHCFTQYTVYDKSLWEAYKSANQNFCDAILKVAKPDDIIWVNDYHLMLLPELIRNEMPEATIGFFLHIPFPPFEIFHLLPWRKELLQGLLGADLIGFHTYDYVHNFLDSIRHILGYDHTLGEITTSERIIKVDSLPMGIDYERYANAIDIDDVHKKIARVHKRLGKHKMIISIDRLDYTKGIPERLEAFDAFLEKYPKYQGKITLIQVSVPSRTKVESYQVLKRRVDELVGKINGKYGTLDWIPIWYLYRSLSFENITALYNVADVALVTPVKDGMNLIAKEFIATKRDGKGVLILSEMAGAAKEMGEALIINPNNQKEMVEALHQAVEMQEEEAIKRNRALQQRLRRYNVRRWAQDFMDGIYAVKKRQQELHAKRLTGSTVEQLVGKYQTSKNRLLILDYDGTLIPLSDHSNQVLPDQSLIEILKELIEQKENYIVVLSGREKNFLERCFGELNVDLVAEHGAMIKHNDRDWETVEPLETAWMEKILPILEHYADRTPRSFILQKEFSIVWNYKNVDEKLASVRSIELKNALQNLATNLNLSMLEGSKVLEIKQAGISKARALSAWLDKKKWDFILAAGDDITDEAVFEILPEDAYSIRVGLSPSEAKWRVNNSQELRSILKKLVQN